MKQAEKFELGKVKLTPLRIKDTEQILRTLFPENDEEWIKLSNIMLKDNNYKE